MNKVVLSALIGIAVAAAAMAAPYFGYPIPLPTLMAAAAAVSLGAAMAVLTRLAIEKPAGKTGREILAGTQLKRADQLLAKFPHGSGAVLLSIRPDTKFETIDVFRYPEKYAGKEVLVTLRNEGPSVFNPVELKRLFAALWAQPGFVHLLLINKHGEYVGYIPGFYAKTQLTGPDAEILIAKHIVGVFEKPETSEALRQIDGAASVDSISDEKTVAEAIERMTGGFRCLVVLKGGYHRKPVGVVTFNTLLGQTLGKTIQTAGGPGGTLGDLRPFH